MIHFVLGLHGRLSQWCDAAVAALLGLEGAGVATHLATGHQPALEEAAVHLVRSRAQHLVVGVRQPREMLRAALADLPARFVLALDDPRAAVALHHEGGGHDLVVCVRNIANLCPLLMQCAAMPGALVVRTGDLADGGAQAVAAIARHLNLTISPDQARAVAEALAALDAGVPYRGFSKLLVAADQRMVDGALAGYAALFAGGELGDITWMRQLFVVGSAGAASTGMVNLRDGVNGRFIVYGPYMQLPPGYWSATLVMGLSPEAVGQTFTADVTAGDLLLASAKVSPRASGVFAAELNFAVAEGQAETLEVRVMIGRDSAPGQFAFGHVTLQAIPGEHASRRIAANSDFRAALTC